MAQRESGRLTGETLGGFHLARLLGAGGMAEVYRAIDATLEREVAIKVLPPSLADDPQYVQRFRDEARHVAALNHPNIVPIYGFGEERGLFYLVMPLEPGSLRDLLARERTLRPQRAVDIALQLASALTAAHALGIVHRDVKPENVLLSSSGDALLTDFGIARDLATLRQQGAARTLAASGLPVGTPEYMAPEQLRGESLDQRADEYALGAVIYEMLTGRAPHEANTPYGVAVLVETEPVTPPSQTQSFAILAQDTLGHQYTFVLQLQ